MLQCKLCEYQSKQLHQHIQAIHKMSANEYRDIFGKDCIMQIGFNPTKKQINHKYSANTRQSYIKIRKDLNNIVDLYTYDETKKILLNNNYYLQLFGKTKNRTLIKQNPKLYKSIYLHTESLTTIPNKSLGFSNFTNRILFITKYDAQMNNLKCKCERTYSFSGKSRCCSSYGIPGKPHSEESRRKQRIKTLEYLSTVKGQIAPRYNVNSIKIIEQYGKDNGYNFQHAENGGEFHVKELGYWVDAYDKEKNVVLEIDESHHFDKNGDYTDRDKRRQEEICKLLQCTFIRIKYND